MTLPLDIRDPAVLRRAREPAVESDDELMSFVRADDWDGLMLRLLGDWCLEGEWDEGRGAWSAEQLEPCPVRVFELALAREARGVMVGLISSMTMAGRTQEALRMQALARELKPELAAEVLRVARRNVNGVHQGLKEAMVTLRSTLATAPVRPGALAEALELALEAGMSEDNPAVEEARALLARREGTAGRPPEAADERA
mmetsp:Transcript_105022/g.338657  ORF Transcript_105022/g.338657 Transcript_105022/m.338657 type:complete len:200 (+) Transcript_105022:65-664(+)